jgi:hypothetical protein
MHAIQILCADNVSVDARTNTVSVFNILEEMTPEVLPAILPRVIFFALLEKDEGDVDNNVVTVKVANNATQLVDNQASISFQGKRRARIITTVGNLLISSPGKLDFSLLDSQQRQIGYWTITIPSPAATLVPNVIPAV